MPLTSFSLSVYREDPAVTTEFDSPNALLASSPAPTSPLLQLDCRIYHAACITTRRALLRLNRAASVRLQRCSCRCLVTFDTYNLVHETNLVYKFSLCVYCFSLHVSGNYVPIIRRKYRTYETPGISHSIQMTVLYGCETWSLTLREERRLRMFEDRVLRRVFGPKRDEVTGEWRKLHKEELRDLYSLPNIVTSR